MEKVFLICDTIFTDALLCASFICGNADENDDDYTDSSFLYDDAEERIYCIRDKLLKMHIGDKREFLGILVHCIDDAEDITAYLSESEYEY